MTAAFRVTFGPGGKVMGVGRLILSKSAATIFVAAVLGVINALLRRWAMQEPWDTALLQGILFASVMVVGLALVGAWKAKRDPEAFASDSGVDTLLRLLGLRRARRRDNQDRLNQ